MTVNEFNDVLAKHIGVPSVSWEDYYLSSIDPITEMHACVTWAAEHYKIGLMSNIMPGFLSQMIQKGLLPQVAYDVVIDSSEVGAIKPEGMIYEIAAARSGVSPQEILLIDDGRTNLMAAEHLGWHVLWFDDYRPSESEDRIRQALAFDE
jgi:FMN phosphatase YigB (HAD superfamily)